MTSRCFSSFRIGIGRERKATPIKVLALTNADSVELFLNGQSLGEKKIDRLEGGEWEVPYAPGKLEGVAKKDGKEYARFSEETTGDPVALKITPDRPDLAGNGADAQPITVSAVDAQGREVPTANLPVTFDLTGPATIIGTGNGDNTSHEPEKTNERSLFNGLAQVILQSQRDSSGTAVLTAKADGITSAEARIGIKPAPPIPSVPPTDPIFALTKWRMSPISSNKPDPKIKIGNTDMNSWTDVQPGSLQKFEGGTWEAFTTSFTPDLAIQKNGGQVRFNEINGIAEVWMGGQLVGEKKDAGAGKLIVKLAPSNAPVTLTVLVNSNGAWEAGLSGFVIVEP